MEHLVLAVVGNYQPHLANEINKLILASDCNIVHCNIVKLGKELTATLLIGGNWNGLAKLENLLPAHEKKLQVQLIAKRTELAPFPADVYPYTAYVIGKAEGNIIPHVTNFFADQGVAIEEVFSEIYATRQTGTNILSLTLTLNIPTEMPISDLRERFILFCDRFNFDGMMEMEKK